MFKKLNKRAIVVLVAVVAVIAIVGGSLAWFVTSSSLSQKFSISGFEVAADVYFMDDTVKWNASNFKDENGLYILSLNPDDSNYIGNLRVDVGHSGAKSCVRVRMNHEWTLADGSVAQYNTAVPYKFGEEWFDNRNTDYCVYYKGTDNSGKAAFTKSALITGFNEKDFDTSGFVDGVTVKVMIQVDSVQTNRYPQMWNIDKLPWK